VFFLSETPWMKRSMAQDQLMNKYAKIVLNIENILLKK